jgi:hypothetical protein
MPTQRKLSKTERVFELPPPLHYRPAPRVKPLRLRAVEPGEKLGDADFGALAWTHGPRARSYAALDTAEPTDGPAFEQPQNLRPSIALRATEEAPRPAVWEPARPDAHRKFAVAQPDDGRRALSRDLAKRAQARDFDARQVVAEHSHNKL